MNRRTFATGLAASAAGSASKPYDVAVIGAGVFGTWTAYMLRKRGKTVALVDAYGPGNSRSSSGGESRIIRMGYGADDVYTRWSIRSLALWTEFFKRVKEPLFHRTGVLWIAGAGDRRTEESRRALAEHRVNFEAFDDVELQRRYPQIRIDQGETGTLETESGALMARRAVEAVARECARMGCEYLDDLVAPPRGGPALEAIKTARAATIRAGVFVFACGPWLGKVFPSILASRIFPSRQEVFFFGPPAADRRFAPPAMPVWIDFGDEAGPYGFPDLERRGFKLAFDRHGPPFDPDSDSRLVSAEGVAAARRYLGGRFPALAGAPLVESRVCQYENTSNGDFLIDRHPEISNVWMVGGGSGHGFKHGPALGEYVAARILDGGAVERRFSLETKEQTQKRAVY